MKAQQFFGGTNPQATGKTVRQVGFSGSQKPAKPTIQRKTTVKQVGTTTNSPANNSQMIRDNSFATRPANRIGRPANKKRVRN